MKIADNHITSIDSFRKHFEFSAVWGQINLFIRDMSPQDIPYPNASAELLYSIIKDPSMVTIDNNTISVKEIDHNPFVLNDTSCLDLPRLKKEAINNRFRILALFELAGLKITQESLADDTISFVSAKEIVLSKGQSLQVCEQNYIGKELVLRQINVDPTSYCSSFVDGVEIQPGKFAYGVFSNAGLHKVLSPIAQNETYRIKLASNDAGMSETIVYNKLDGTNYHICNVISFCTIGKDNFAYIENNMVYCHHNESLALRIREVVDFLDSPLFIQVINNSIVITMKDGNTKIVNIE